MKNMKIIHISLVNLVDHFKHVNISNESRLSVPPGSGLKHPEVKKYTCTSLKPLLFACIIIYFCCFPFVYQLFNGPKR